MTDTIISDNTTGTYIGDYAGTEDTYLASDAADTNYSTTNPLSINTYSITRRALIAFSGLSNISGPVTVSAATINLYRAGGNTGVTLNTDAYKVLVSYSETQVTYNNRETSGPTAWTGAGCSGSGTDRSSTASATTNVGDTTGVYYAWNVASDVEDDINGVSTHYGWVLEHLTTTRFSNFTAENGTDGQRPALSVTYTAVGGTTLQGSLMMMGAGI